MLKLHSLNSPLEIILILQNYNLEPLNHVHILQVPPQLNRGETVATPVKMNVIFDKQHTNENLGNYRNGLKWFDNYNPIQSHMLCSCRKTPLRVWGYFVGSNASTYTFVIACGACYNGSWRSETITFTFDIKMGVKVIFPFVFIRQCEPGHVLVAGIETAFVLVRTDKDDLEVFTGVLQFTVSLDEFGCDSALHFWGVPLCQRPVEWEPGDLYDPDELWIFHTTWHKR